MFTRVTEQVTLMQVNVTVTCYYLWHVTNSDWHSKKCDSCMLLDLIQVFISSRSVRLLLETSHPWKPQNPQVFIVDWEILLDDISKGSSS